MNADAAALDWFDRLAELAPPERQSRLATLAETDPGLHARVSAMLATLDNEAEASQQLRNPIGSLAGSSHQAGDVIAGWRLERPLGQGGMASVWLATRADGQLQRPAALKLPLTQQGVLAERFVRERELLAALDHPHIARLYDAGVDAQGQAYLALEYVDGRPLDQAAEGLDREARIRLLLQVLDAVAHAHRHMAVHRDLKPANILVDAQGQVKLLDFGIAKLLEPPAGQATLTLDAASVLTPLYAAPEQVSGGAVTTVTDVHAAAVVLFELLTGRLPRGAHGMPLAQALRAVAEQQPAAPGLGAELDAVLLKALAFEPGDRYPSADAFADELRRVLAHEPVLARRSPWWQRLALLLRRHRRASLAGAAAALLLGSAGAVAALQWQETQAQRERGDAVRDFIFRAMSEAEPEQGRRELSARDLLTAAVARAQADFATQPRLQGELLAELGRVQVRLELPEAAATLDAARERLEQSAPVGDAVRHRNEANLARALSSSDPERGEAMARAALAGCTQPSADCAHARGLAHFALASIDSRRGRNPESLVHAQAMLAEARSNPQPDLKERIAALETVAGTARNAGQLQIGVDAIREALQLAQGQVLKATNRERLELIGAALDNDLGRHAEAAATLLRLAEAAPSSAEKVLRLRLASGAMLGAGEAARALQTARAAEAALAPEATAGEKAFVQQALARAAALAGEPAQASQALARSRELMQAAGFAPRSNAPLRLDRLEGELALRRGEPAKAQALLQTLREHEAAARIPPTEVARTLELLGCAASRLQQPDAAERAWAEADRLLAGLLAADHPRRVKLAAARGGSAACES